MKMSRSININKMSIEEKKRLYNQLVKDLPSPDESYESESEDQDELEPETAPERAPTGSSKKKTVSKIIKPKNKIIEESESEEESEEIKPKKRNIPKKKVQTKKTSKFKRLKRDGTADKIKEDKKIGASYKFLAAKYDCSLPLIKRLIEEEDSSE
jgi:hypothetical protein